MEKGQGKELTNELIENAIDSALKGSLSGIELSSEEKFELLKQRMLEIEQMKMTEYNNYAYLVSDAL